MIDEIKENEVPKVLENKEQQLVPQTPTSVRRSTRPLEWFSPSLYYWLMIDSSELECYEEAMKVETKNKWEQGMN